jgi:hypothetical protein
MSLFKTWLGTDATPNEYSVIANWLSSGTAGIPAATDVVLIPTNTINISAGLDQHLIVLNSFTISDSYTGRIGTTGISGSYLQIASPLVYLHFPTEAGGNGLGSDMIKLDLGSSTAPAITIFGSANSSAEDGLEPIRIINTPANTKLYQENGLVGLATTKPGEVATILQADLLGGTLNFGAGVTLGTLIQDGGNTNINCAATTVTQNGGTLTTYGVGAITTATIDGDATFNSTGTITTLNVEGNGTADLKKIRSARAVTTINLYAGATLKGGAHITVGTLNLVGCTLEDVTIEWDGALTVNFVR